MGCGDLLLQTTNIICQCKKSMLPARECPSEKVPKKTCCQKSEGPDSSVAVAPYEEICGRISSKSKRLHLETLQICKETLQDIGMFLQDGENGHFV